MSRKIKTIVAAAVLIAAMGASTANAALVHSVAQRRQHPGVGFVVNNHQHHAFSPSLTANGFPVYRQPVVNRFRVVPQYSPIHFGS